MTYRVMAIRGRVVALSAGFLWSLRCKGGVAASKNWKTNGALRIPPERNEYIPKKIDTQLCKPDSNRE